MTVEVLFKTAWGDLKDRQGLVAAYLVAFVILACTVRALRHFVLPEEDPVPLPLWLPAFRFAQQLGLVALAAAIQTVVFSRLGRSIDLPLWKCRDDAEALRRFFLLWFLVNLGYVTLDQLASNAYHAGAVDIAYSILMLIMLYTILVFPVAVCMMYAGRFTSVEVGEVLAPLTRDLAISGAVFLLLALYFFVQVALVSLIASPDSLAQELVGAAVITVPMALFEVFLFAAVWRLCMFHRDTAYEDEEDPFD